MIEIPREILSGLALSTSPWAHVEAAAASTAEEMRQAKLAFQAIADRAQDLAIQRWTISPERLRALTDLLTSPRAQTIARKKLRRYARTIGKTHTY